MTSILINLNIPKDTKTCKGCEYLYDAHGKDNPNHCSLFNGDQCYVGYGRLNKCLEAQKLAEQTAGELARAKKLLKKY